MMSNARCWTLRLAVLAIATSLLTGCATVGSDVGAPCPPVVSYTSADRARAAEEVEALPEGGMIFRMLADYAVLREQARACGIL